MILFDAHVHIYDCFDLNVFFETASKNLISAGENIGTQDFSRFLLLAESSKCNYFKRLPGLSLLPNESGNTMFWQISEKEPGLSYTITPKDQPGKELILVAGRQLVTAEGLELLALMTPDTFSDGLSLEEAVDTVTDSGGIAVCPWGAGKWLGRRGKVLEKFLEKNTKRGFFLGDSGGRPSIWPRSSYCCQEPFAARLLSGSDPLPLAGQEKVAGSYGGVVDAVCSTDTPAAELKNLLLQEKTTIRPFGGSMCPLTFAKTQVALRLRK